MELTRERLVGLLSAALACDVRENNGSYHFGNRGREFQPLDSVDLDQVVSVLDAYVELDDTTVVLDNSYELLVQYPRPLTLSRLWRDGLRLEDTHLGLTYHLGPASDPYAVLLLLKFADKGGAEQHRFLRNVYLSNRSRYREGEQRVFDALKLGLRTSTLRIVSDTPRANGFWKSYADSLFFHLGYNLDSAVIPQRSLDELLRPSRISNVRRSRLAELDAPRRHYNPDLVYHYQLGVSAESPMLEYISYYHVVEHWFERVYQDDLVEQVQTSITSPAFSYKRKDDIRQLIKKVSKAVQLRDDRLVIDEQTALRLTLERYVEVEELASDLSAFDPELLVYYSKSKVGFSSGDAVPFHGPDHAATLAALSRRIYKTRNALVHSKDGPKNRFMPFTHDKELISEVPLIRFVAEQIIMRTSSIPT